MCGIAGIVDARAPLGAREQLQRMIAALHHRGPDGNGVHVDGPCGLAHARLSIIDLAGGAQPMLADAGQLAITFNGEIFNYVELKKELEALGRVFQSKSDTEVILHAYAHWGDRCVERFNGQWSFALWDARKKRLFCARDRIGVRPFFWTRHDGRFVFASEAKALFAAGVPAAIDPKGLNEVITFWCALAPRTVWQGVNELPPGHTLVVEDGNVDVRRYWDLDYTVDESLAGRSTSSIADDVFNVLLDAARIRLRADVPVGSYLSGGLDSSVIAGLIARHTETPLETFSVTFEDKEFDESVFQREVAAHLGTRHRSVPTSSDDIGRIFPDVIHHTETPLVRTAPAPMFKLAGLVRESGYKVVLTGEGADEMLGGYDIFKEAKIRRFWAQQPSSKLRPLLLKRLYPWMKNLQSQSPAYLKAFFHVGDTASPFFSHLPRWRLTQQLGAFLHDDVRASLAGHDPLEDLRARLPAAFGSWDHLAQAQYLESTTLLPGYILSSQGDRMAMGRSIEGRYPFLDVRVMELAARLPAHVKMKVLDEKHVLKVAASAERSGSSARGPLVPPSVRARPKQPYRAPDAQSFFAPGSVRARHTWVDEVLSRDALARSGLFDVEAASKLVEKARRGAAVGTKDNMGLVFILSTQLMRDRFLLS